MRAFGFAALLLLAASAVDAQTIPAPGDAPYTLKSSTQRVLVDVVVRDKNGNPIHGLKQSDFTVLENGDPQTMRSFDEHVGLSEAEAAAAPKMPALPPGQFTNFLPVKPSSALTVILFDRLNTGLRDQQYVRQQLIDYLKKARPDARIAIFGLNSRLVLLQGFSSDPKRLLAALDGKNVTQISPLRDDVIGGGNGVEDLSSAVTASNAVGGSSAAIQAFEAQYQQFQQQIQGKITLDALNQIARSLTSVPGRKNLIWFAGNFPSAFFPGDNSTTVPYAPFADMEKEFEQTIDLLTSSQIAIYPVDAQGLRTNASNNAGLSNPQYGTVRGQLGRGGLGASSDLTNEDAAIGREHIGMDQIAHDTGGSAFYNNNDLGKAVDDAISAGSNYYTLSYAPSNTDKKPDFRRIAVKLDQDAKLSYRRGYYIDSAATKAGTLSPRTQIAGAAPAPVNSLHAALMNGGPEPTEILLRVKAVPVTTGTEPTVVQGNSPNPDPNKSKGPYLAFQVDYATSMRAVLMRKTSDNLFHADIEFVIYVYDDKGTLVNAQANTFRGTFDAKELADTLRAGLPFTQRISVPQKGQHVLRVAVHDNIGDKVGAVEIAVADLTRLPPLQPAAPAPATANK